MQRRNYYTEVEDFLVDKSFQLWVLSKIDEKGWEEWTLENQQRAKLVENARLLLLAMKVAKVDLSQNEIQLALQSTWEKIEKKENFYKQTQKFKRIYLQKYWLSSVAAIFFFCFLLVWIYNNRTAVITAITYNKHVQEKDRDLVEQINNSNKQQLIPYQMVVRYYYNPKVN